MHDNEALTLRSSIKTDLMRYTLMKGTILAGTGMLILLMTGAFIPPSILSTWGFLIFIIGIALITWGLLPYRRLRRLEMNPYTLSSENEQWLHFISNGNLLFSIPWQSIERVEYFDSKRDYGIRLMLKDPVPKKIVVREKDFAFENFEKRSKNRYGCDLFFPYFSQRAFNKLSVAMPKT